MKIGVEWPGGFFVESKDLQIPWKIISFAAEKLGRQVWLCIEYVQGKFENSDTLVFRVVIVQPPGYKFSINKEAVYTYCSRPHFAREEGLRFSEEDVVKAGEGLVETIAHRLDQISRQIKDMSNDFEIAAELARRADAIFKK